MASFVSLTLIKQGKSYCNYKLQISIDQPGFLTYVIPEQRSDVELWYGNYETDTLQKCTLQLRMTNSRGADSCTPLVSRKLARPKANIHTFEIKASRNGQHELEMLIEEMNFYHSVPISVKKRRDTPTF